ncbi:MAG TPA: lipocalin family protein [Blastocatellia bacterium]|nr:lipocalin family protein [Blastocatellia bacterium]
MKRVFPFITTVILVLGGVLLWGGEQSSSSTLAQGLPVNQLYGHWVYASGESGGKTTAVYGDLKFTSDGKFDDSRRIGGIGGFRRGTFSVRGDQLTLKFDDGKNSQTYRFSFGTKRDKDGKEFKTLLLRGNDLSFLLTKKEVK